LGNENFETHDLLEAVDHIDELREQLASEFSAVWAYNPYKEKASWTLGLLIKTVMNRELSS